MPRMSFNKWAAFLAFVSLVVMFVLGHFFQCSWFKDNEHIAIWLEGVALVAIFALDLYERAAHSLEQKEENEKTRTQMTISRDQAQAAIAAANAARLSAELAIALNRPLVGIDIYKFEGNPNDETWRFLATVKNYGTLPAKNVSAQTEYFIDKGLRKNIPGAQSVEIFPSNVFEYRTDFTFGKDEVGKVPQGKQELSYIVTIKYESEDRKFMYVATGAYKSGRMDAINTSTVETK